MYTTTPYTCVELTVKDAIRHVSANGLSLVLIPPALKTPEVCLAAVEENSEALEHVPLELKTEKLCMLAVAKDGASIRFVPDDLKTELICQKAVKHTYLAILHIPKHLHQLALEDCTRSAIEQSYKGYYRPIYID